MNIAYILNSTLPSSGATKSFMVMLRAIMGRDVKPIIILPDREGIYQEIVAMGIPTIVITFRANTYPQVDTLTDALLFPLRLVGRLTVNYLATRKLLSILPEKNIDIIHTNVSIVNIGYKAARRLGIPHIYHIREFVNLDFNMHYIPSLHHLREQFFTPNSYSICITKSIQQHHGLSGHPGSQVIYNGICPPMDSCPHLPKEDYLLFAGRIEPAKGLIQLLESYLLYTKHCSSPLSLQIAGAAHNKNYYDSATQFVRDNGIGHLVSFLGNRKDISLLMQKAKAIIIPSRFEAFGRCAAEAMFNGCLVIGKNSGGTKEQFDNGLELEGADIALRYDNNEELAHHLLSITNHYDTFQPYIARAFHTVNRLYTTESNAQQVYSLYKSHTSHPENF